nr:uncharacterized protein LOC120968960 [Aegilops tauschii subsp. strangulata]
MAWPLPRRRCLVASVRGGLQVAAEEGKAVVGVVGEGQGDASRSSSMSEGTGWSCWGATVAAASAGCASFPASLRCCLMAHANAAGEHQALPALAPSPYSHGVAASAPPVSSRVSVRGGLQVAAEEGKAVVGVVGEGQGDASRSSSMSEGTGWSCWGATVAAASAGCASFPASLRCCLMAHANAAGEHQALPALAPSPYRYEGPHPAVSLHRTLIYQASTSMTPSRNNHIHVHVVDKLSMTPTFHEDIATGLGIKDLNML